MHFAPHQKDIHEVNSHFCEHLRASLPTSLAALSLESTPLYVSRSRLTEVVEMFNDLTSASKALGSLAPVSSSSRNRPMAKNLL